MRAALAAVVALAAVACGGDGDDLTTQDRATLNAFVRFARAPSEVTWRAVPFAETVRLGLGETLRARRSARELAQPAAWQLQARLFNAYVGPFSPLEPLAGRDRLAFTAGRHARCASPPGDAPAQLASLRRLAIQPARIDSCLQWFAVDLYVDGDGRIVGVTLDIWEP
jgi:hypothetical protein